MWLSSIKNYAFYGAYRVQFCQLVNVSSWRLFFNSFYIMLLPSLLESHFEQGLKTSSFLFHSRVSALIRLADPWRVLSITEAGSAV